MSLRGGRPSPHLRGRGRGGDLRQSQGEGLRQEQPRGGDLQGRTKVRHKEMLVLWECGIL